MSFIYVCRVALVVPESFQPFRPWPARLLCHEGGLSRQEYWSTLGNTGCHILLECYISFALVTNWPEYLVLPEPPQAAAPPFLALTGANTSLPEQPQEQSPVNDPKAEVKIKSELKPRASVAKGNTKPSYYLY